ncbi:Neurochondrin/leucine-rich protein (Neurochondrin) [Handroanthus impetiginosus]|uniref:Neurochondrin/leucine-rich protein (Neurochondrin) n=1 Tax=Handroanthus impetiginosus TaxID=429701 RepID=A0A2G9I053_9LAMI|nr:Neurochondrin/leucine-rich protein (Neurochondrin) [Handroanthus impetiginosus]
MEQGSTSETEPKSLQAPASTPSSSSSPSPSLEDVMKLLRGKTDSQRLAGLLLVTKFCDKNDQHTILNVYHALGSTFLHRLLLTGMGKGTGGADNANREAYLRLSVTVLAAFARVSQIAATDEMLAKVPLILEVMSGEYGSCLREDCHEFLFLVSTAHENGVITLYESGGINVLASQMPTLPDGSHVMELAMKLVQLIISKLPAEKVYVDHPSELSKMVAAIAKQFAVLHNALKFEALHILSTVLSSNYSGTLNAVLQSMTHGDWSTSMRAGIMDILQNRVAPAEKLQALVLAECVISIIGVEWLIGPVTLHEAHSSSPADRCMLLVLESSRVEIAVILNELAYLKYEASKNSPPNAETFLVKLRDLGVAFSLVERIIKLISRFGDNEGLNSTSIISESTFTKIIGGLNETVGVVLEYLQDAKDHGERKGDDLLASVRLVGSYLAEAPHACRDKVKELLGYMLSVQGEDESSPFHSISFLLPLLCQITMKNDGCKIFASAGAFDAVVGCLISFIGSKSSRIEDGSTIFLACDTILNFLLKREQLHLSLDNSSSVKLLQALSHWTEDTLDTSVIMMASSICSLILDATSEEALLRHPDFNMDNLIALSQLIKRSLVTCGQDMMSHDANSEADLHQIISSGYCSWRDRFPVIREVVER